MVTLRSDHKISPEAGGFDDEVNEQDDKRSKRRRLLKLAEAPKKIKADESELSGSCVFSGDVAVEEQSVCQEEGSENLGERESVGVLPDLNDTEEAMKEDEGKNADLARKRRRIEGDNDTATPSAIEKSQDVVDVKVCDICGDAGFEDKLALCPECNEGAEHIYCMKTPLQKLPGKGEWFCEACKIRQAERELKLRNSAAEASSKPEAALSKPEAALSKPVQRDVLKRSDSFHIRPPELGKVKPLGESSARVTASKSLVKATSPATNNSLETPKSKAFKGFKTTPKSVNPAVDSGRSSEPIPQPFRHQAPKSVSAALDIAKTSLRKPREEAEALKKDEAIKISDLPPTRLVEALKKDLPPSSSPSTGTNGFAENTRPEKNVPAETKLLNPDEEVETIKNEVHPSKKKDDLPPPKEDSPQLNKILQPSKSLLKSIDWRAVRLNRQGSTNTTKGILEQIIHSQPSVAPQQAPPLPSEEPPPLPPPEPVLQNVQPAAPRPVLPNLQPLLPWQGVLQGMESDATEAKAARTGGSELGGSGIGGAELGGSGGKVVPPPITVPRGDLQPTVSSRLQDVEQAVPRPIFHVAALQSVQPAVSRPTFQDVQAIAEAKGGTRVGGAELGRKVVQPAAVPRQDVLRQNFQLSVPRRDVQPTVPRRDVQQTVLPRPVLQDIQRQPAVPQPALRDVTEAKGTTRIGGVEAGGTGRKVGQPTTVASRQDVQLTVPRRDVLPKGVETTVPRPLPAILRSPTLHDVADGLETKATRIGGAEAGGTGQKGAGDVQPTDSRPSLQAVQPAIDVGDGVATGIETGGTGRQDVQQTAASRPAVLQDFQPAAVPVDVPAMPSFNVVWRGSFEVSSTAGLSVYDFLQAHPSDRASPKVLEASRSLSSSLKLQEVDRVNSWPKKLTSPPNDLDIALYFFPAADESSVQYNQLLDRMVNFDLVLKGVLDNAELLLFPSIILAEAFRFWRNKMYLWGIFQGRKQVQKTLDIPESLAKEAPGVKKTTDSTALVIDMDIDTTENLDKPPGFEKPASLTPLDINFKSRSKSPKAQEAPGTSKTKEKGKLGDEWKKEKDRIRGSRDRDRVRERSRSRSRERERDKQKDRERDRKRRKGHREYEKKGGSKYLSKSKSRSSTRYRSRSRSLSPLPRRRERSRSQSRSRSPPPHRKHRARKSSTESSDSGERSWGERLTKKQAPRYHNFMLDLEQPAMGDEATQPLSLFSIENRREGGGGGGLIAAAALEEQDDDQTPLTLSLAVPQYRKTGNSWVKVEEEVRLGADDVNFALTL